MRDSTFTGNSASLGGGLYNDGTATVRDSTFAGNSADAGGGLANGPHSTTTVTVIDSTFTGNSASLRRRPLQLRWGDGDGDGDRQHLHRQLRPPWRRPRNFGSAAIGRRR